MSLHGQAVKTSPSHGENWGSSPHGGARSPTRIRYDLGRGFFYPIGIEGACGKGGMGRFTESYGSDSASLYRKPGADGQTGLFRDQNRIRMNCGYIPTIVRYGIAICIADLEAKSLYHRKLER